MNAKVLIPGDVVAHVVDGLVTGFTFTPAAAHPGHFGPAARLVEADDMAVEGDLEPGDVAGPFWDAVRAALFAGRPIVWSE